MDVIDQIQELFARSSLETRRTEEVVKNVLALFMGSGISTPPPLPNNSFKPIENLPRAIPNGQIQARHLGFWDAAREGYVPGIYSPEAGVPHPCQDRSFPFIYLPHTDEYVGFRWDYEDVGPLVPALTVEVLHSLPGLFLCKDPSDCHSFESSNWTSRFTVVMFKLPQTYYSSRDMLGTIKLLYSPGYETRNEVAGQHHYVALHPNAKSLQDVGYEAIYAFDHLTCPVNSPPELFLFSPGAQVTRTIWYEWKATP